jgi:Spy/CpxP family protein refolding chaperone
MKRIMLPASLALSLALSGSMVFAQQPQSNEQAPQNTPDAQQAAPGAQQPSAWQHHGHRHDPQRETARLTRTLNLTPDQASRLEPILADRDQKMAALHSNQALAPQDRHQQMHVIQQSTREQMEAILTPAQMQQLRAMHHGRHGSPDQPQQANPSPGA